MPSIVESREACHGFGRSAGGRQAKRPFSAATAVQARQPLYTKAAGRWKKYKHTLATLFARMESMVSGNPANRLYRCLGNRVRGWKLLPILLIASGVTDSDDFNDDPSGPAGNDYGRVDFSDKRTDCPSYRVVLRAATPEIC